MAKGRDINFSKKNTAFDMINYVNKEWNREFILVFPLKNIPDGLNANKIEKIIANYLIGKGVPIIDFYSHSW